MMQSSYSKDIKPHALHCNFTKADWQMSILLIKPIKQKTPDARKRLLRLQIYVRQM